MCVSCEKCVIDQAVCLCGGECVLKVYLGVTCMLQRYMYIYMCVCVCVGVCVCAVKMRLRSSTHQTTIWQLVINPTLMQGCTI